MHENYLQRTAEELGLTKKLHAVQTVEDAVRLTQAAISITARRHASSAETHPTTLLGNAVKRLVETGASFETRDNGVFLCGAAEWHFADALVNPAVNDGRPDYYELTTIYTRQGTPVLVAKGDPHGKPAAIVCGETEGDDRFTLGMMGHIYSGHNFRPRFKGQRPGVIVKPLPDDLIMKVIRPSTWVSFPPEVRKDLVNMPYEMSDAMAKVHKHWSIEKTARAAQSLLDQSS